MKKFLLGFSFIWSGFLSAQSSFQLLKDIYPGDPNCSAIEFTVVDDRVFFWADSLESGRELWVTDGTTDGTYMVKEIMPGEFGSAGPLYGSWMKSMIGMDGILYFCASDQSHGYELWRSDGSADGTYMVKDINTGSSGAFPANIMDMPYMAVMDHILYFQAYNSTTGAELWRSDGTDAGTWLLKEIVPGSTGGEIEMMEEEGGRLYFSCRNAAGHYAVWTSDGTVEGTIELGEIKLLTYDPSVSDHFVEYNGWVYFAGGYSPTFSGYDFHLWRTDGSPQGTSLFMDFGLTDGSNPRGIFATTNGLFFHTSNTDDDTFYTSDGTIEGTMELFTAEGYDMTPVDNPNSSTSYLKGETVIYFPATVNDVYCLIKSDGTAAGTHPIWNTSMGNYYVEAQGRHNQTTVGDNLVYGHLDEVNGCNALFQCNGTEQGVMPAASCLEVLNPQDMVTLGNKVIVYMKDAPELYGYELYVFDLDFDAVGIENVEEKIVTKCYPNPTREKVWIQTGYHQPAFLKLFDQTGHLVLSGNFQPDAGNRINLDLSKYPVGIYFLNYMQRGQLCSLKVIKE